MSTKDEQTAPEASSAKSESKKPRKLWYAPKFMVSNMSETANTSANSSDHHGGSIS